MLVPFTLHYKLFLTAESADEICKASLKCHHTNESYRAVLPCGAFYYYCIRGESHTSHFVFIMSLRLHAIQTGAWNRFVV